MKCGWIVFATALAPLCAQTPAVPIDAISGIVGAFRTHPIVALGNVEFRGNEQAHAFQLALISDPRLAGQVNDIVVEFGSARYQDVVDRFVRGEDVPDRELRRVWQDTTQFEIEWDLPIYEDFYRRVRKINESLPLERKVRVLLGDPPMNWDSVHDFADLRKAIGDRDGFAVEVVRREVLAKRRRALLIYGGQHLIRSEGARGIVARLENEDRISVFTVMPETRRDLTGLEPGVVSWPVPSLVLLPGTTIGAAVDRRSVRMESQVDALLYLGQPATMTTSTLSRDLCMDRSYMEMRLQRLSLAPPPPGAAMSLADQLRQYCAAATQKAPHP